MRAWDIDPGMLLLGWGGQVREVVSIRGEMAQYKQVVSPQIKHSTHPLKGEMRTVKLSTLAAWAKGQMDQLKLTDA